MSAFRQACMHAYAIMSYNGPQARWTSGPPTQNEPWIQQIHHLCEYSHVPQCNLVKVLWLIHPERTLGPPILVACDQKSDATLWIHPAKSWLDLFFFFFKSFESSDAVVARDF